MCKQLASFFLLNIVEKNILVYVFHRLLFRPDELSLPSTSVHLSSLVSLDEKEKLSLQIKLISLFSLPKAPIRPSISIIHNISRHDDGITVLNTLNAINIIKTI